MLERDEFNAWVAEAYRRALTLHGALGLDCEVFATQLSAIARKHHARDAPAESVWAFLNKLHTDDLYLAIACACHTEAAWLRFDAVYRKHFNDLCRYLCATSALSSELAETLWSDLFLPDRSGHSRIASYDGRSSLTTWLRVIVTNRVINEVQRRSYGVQRLDGMAEVADQNALTNVEAGLRWERYGSMILKGLEHACKTLTEQERLLVLRRYGQGLRLGEIAGMLNIHQSTVTRQLDRLLKKLRREVCAHLASQYHLSSEAIEECLSMATEAEFETLSILALIEDPPHYCEQSV